MKRFGRIMFCFLPALLAFGLQQLNSIPAVGLALLGGFYTKGATSIDDCMNAFLNIISTANFNAGVSAAYGTAVSYTHLRAQPTVLLPLWYLPTGIIKNSGRQNRKMYGNHLIFRLSSAFLLLQ